MHLWSEPKIKSIHFFWHLRKKKKKSNCLKNFYQQLKHWTKPENSQPCSNFFFLYVIISALHYRSYCLVVVWLKRNKGHKPNLRLTTPNYAKRMIIIPPQTTERRHQISSNSELIAVFLYRLSFKNNFNESIFTVWRFSVLYYRFQEIKSNRGNQIVQYVKKMSN